MIKFKNINKEYDRYINYALIAYAFCLPLSKAGVNIFEVIMLLLWILQGEWKRKFQLYKHNILIVSILSLIAVSLISIFWASSINFALHYIAKYRHFLIILVIYSSLNKIYIEKIFSAFLLGMFGSEVMSYGIFLELWHYKNVLPSDPSPFMSHTDYSIYLAFTSVLLLTRLIDKRENNLKLKIAYALFWLSSTANLFVNGGRTGQVTFIVLVFISIVMSVKNKIKAIFISSILITMIFIIAFNYSPNFHNRFNQAKVEVQNLYNQDDYRGSLSTRILLWKLGIVMFEDHYLLGTGIGNDMKNIKIYADNMGIAKDKRQDLSDFGDHHNTFITLSVQLGIFGLLIIGTIFYSLFKLQFKNPIHKILSLTFVVGFFLWSFGGITFHTMNPMVFFALFAGIFNKISTMETKEEVII